jgi:hypothetical protein
MGVMVIAAYRPKPGQEARLLQLVKEHLPILRSQNLVAPRPSYAMRARDGTILEVFEWKSEQAIESAHQNPVIIAMWERFEEVCDYVPLNSLKESAEPFSGYEPIDFS